MGVPKLGVMYEPGSFSLFGLVQESADRWRNVWLVDTGAVPSSDVRLLRRFGDIVEIGGLSDVAVADTLARHGVEGIVAFADGQLARTAGIAEAAGLPCNSPRAAWCLTNKFAQRSALRAAGVPVPDFLAVPAGTTSAAHLEAELFFPAVLKPQVGNGGRDTYPVATVAELDEALACLNKRGVSQDMIVEGYLPDRTLRGQQAVGDYVSVETLVADGISTTVMVTGRMPLAEPFRETGAFIPSNLPAEELRQVAAMAEAAAAALGVTFGCLHTEVKLTPQGPRVIEVNGRIGGGGLPEMLRLAAGFSITRAVCEIALRRPVNVAGIVPTHHVGYQFALQPPKAASRLDGLDGVAELAEHPGVERVSLNRQVGDAVDWTDGSYGYVVAMLGVAEGHEQMLRMYAALNRAAQFS